jgi:hypothetical protein
MAGVSALAMPVNVINKARANDRKRLGLGFVFGNVKLYEIKNINVS